MPQYRLVLGCSSLSRNSLLASLPEPQPNSTTLSMRSKSSMPRSAPTAATPPAAPRHASACAACRARRTPTPAMLGIALPFRAGPPLHETLRCREERRAGARAHHPWALVPCARAVPSACSPLEGLSN
eukprot:scaffold699_cov385-Prasinococcus_capsulatus_cf.AAC.26